MAIAIAFDGEDTAEMEATKSQKRNLIAFVSTEAAFSIAPPGDFYQTSPVRYP